MSSRRTSVRSLGDLRRAQSTDTALRNLLGILMAKLELFASLPVYEYEASAEGNDSFAVAFQRLAEQERRSFNELLITLRAHLDEMAPEMNGDDSNAVTGGRSLV